MSVFSSACMPAVTIVFERVSSNSNNNLLTPINMVKKSFAQSNTCYIQYLITMVAGLVAGYFPQYLETEVHRVLTLPSTPPLLPLATLTWSD